MISSHSTHQHHKISILKPFDPTTNNSLQTCSICLEDLQSTQKGLAHISSNTSHPFHDTCIRTHIVGQIIATTFPNCPNCRALVTLNDDTIPVESRINELYLRGRRLLDPNTTMTIDDSPCSSLDCYLEAMKLNDTAPLSWYNLGIVLGKKTINYQDNVYCTKKCYLRALELNPTYVKAWGNLGEHLGPKETIRFNMKEFTKVDCYLEALKYNPKDSITWGNLGAALFVSPRTVTVQEKEYDARACYLTALDINPTDALIWVNLQMTLRPDEAIVFKEKKYDKKSCCVTALRFNPSYGRAWQCLSQLLRDDETIEVNGVAYDKVSCFQQYRTHSFL